MIVFLTISFQHNIELKKDCYTYNNGNNSLIYLVIFSKELVYILFYYFLLINNKIDAATIVIVSNKIFVSVAPVWIFLGSSTSTTVIFISSHLAYKVVSLLNVWLKEYGVVNSLFKYHPANVNPSLTGFCERVGLVFIGIISCSMLLP